MSTGQQSFVRTVFARFSLQGGHAQERRQKAKARFLQTTAVGCALVLLLSDSMSAVPANPTMPRLTPVSAADVETPDQNDGNAEGLGHESESALVDGTQEATGTGPDVEAPEGALPYEWPELPEDADTLAPPDLESPKTRLAEDESEPEVTGFDPETSVELEEERDEYSRTFENEDGTLSTDFSQEPLHYQEDDGSWQEVDPSLVPESSLT